MSGQGQEKDSRRDITGADWSRRPGVARRGNVVATLLTTLDTWTSR